MKNELEARVDLQSLSRRQDQPRSPQPKGSQPTHPWIDLADQIGAWRARGAGWLVTDMAMLIEMLIAEHEALDQIADVGTLSQARTTVSGERMKSRLCGRCGCRADQHIHLYGSQHYLCPTVGFFRESDEDQDDLHTPGAVSIEVFAVDRVAERGQEGDTRDSKSSSPHGDA